MIRRNEERKMRGNEWRRQSPPVRTQTRIPATSYLVWSSNQIPNTATIYPPITRPVVQFLCALPKNPHSSPNTQNTAQPTDPLHRPVRPHEHSRPTPRTSSQPAHMSTSLSDRVTVAYTSSFGSASRSPRLKNCVLGLV